MNFDELTINGNNKDDNRSVSATTAVNPEIETCFSETPLYAATSSVNHSCSVNQPVSTQDLQTDIRPYPFEAHQNSTGFQRGHYFLYTKRL